MATRDYSHPYEPYSIQNDLMNAVYACIEAGKVGIFESPTGTGKSLSLICSSLTWLSDFHGQTLGDEDGQETNDGEPSWVHEHARSERQSVLRERRAELEARLMQIRQEGNNGKHRHRSGSPGFKRRKVALDAESKAPDEESQFVLDDYDSESENVTAKSSTASEPAISGANLEMMRKLGLVYKAPDESGAELVDETKIIFCSRTHSQLSQFVHELRRVKLPAPEWASDNAKKSKTVEETVVIRHVPLGSRKNLCINPTVNRLANAMSINERCLELQQPGTSKGHKCIFLPTEETKSLVSDFRDSTLAKIRDIEDVASLGREIGICPYYASRTVIKPSEIITLPYPLLLQKSAREALGLSLKGHVVIIDEAHNLIDTISNIYSVTISIAQLSRARLQLGTYLQKFRNRLKGKNRTYIAQLIRTIDSLKQYGDRKSLEPGPDGIATVSEMMSGKGVDQINLYKLIAYLQQSKLARKVEGYVQFESLSAEHKAENQNEHGKISALPTLTQVQSFLEALMNPDIEGRFFFEKGNEDGSITLKYMLLDATQKFQEVVEEARAVILAGGTMSPMDDYADNLFPYLDKNRLLTWSCGHIIAKENLVALPMTNGPGGIEFDFTLEKRTRPQIIDALGHTVCNICKIIPDGVVVFFPSYAYLDQVVARWQSTSATHGPSLWDRIAAAKPIFQETKSNQAVESLLTAYAQSVSTNRGGVLLSVIGGKLSEGINFSDALGRGVIVVGLPFPNMHSAEWKARLQFIEQAATKRTGSRQQGQAASREFYENSCMRAVNQSIGRAIRHRNDYASIVLVDRRYDTPRIRSKLPAWIRQSMTGGHAMYGSAEKRLTDFFARHENKIP